MNAYELADLAALVAIHGEQLIAADAATMDHVLANYWKGSRCRLDRWYRVLARAAKHNDRVKWTQHELGTVEEILVSEILAHVVTAVAAAHDRCYAASESAPVARNIFDCHMDVKRRAVAIVVAPHHDYELADDFLSLRRQCERWTDLLLAYLAPHVATDEFAVDAARVGDFALDAREHLRSRASSDMAVTMIIAGMRSSLAPLTKVRAPNADLNVEIATALVGGFLPDFFDSHGQLRSPWLERLCRVPKESPMPVDKWWHTVPHGAHEVPRPVRWQR